MNSLHWLIALLCIWMVAAGVFEMDDTVEDSGDLENVEKRGRNPYSWMSMQKMRGEKRARNPYSWMTSQQGKRARNPYSWMAGGEKVSKRSARFVDDVYRQPRNPYSWQYTMFDKRTRNPYSWMHE